MFQKTAAIAVLILLISSMFAGSVTYTPVAEQADASTAGQMAPVQQVSRGALSVSTGTASVADGSGPMMADGPVSIEHGPDGFVFYGKGDDAGTAIIKNKTPAAPALKSIGMGLWHLMPFWAARGMMGEAYDREGPGAGVSFAHFGLITGSYASDVTVFDATGASPEDDNPMFACDNNGSFPMTAPAPDTFVFKGNVTDSGRGSAGTVNDTYGGSITKTYHTIYIDMNNSSLMLIAPPPSPHAFKVNAAGGGWESVRVIDRHRTINAGPMDMVLHSQVFMLDPTGAELWRDNMSWEARNVVMEEPGMVNFSANFTKSWHGSGGVAGPPGFIVAGDEIEFYGSMAMDKAKLMASTTFADEGAAEANPYNDEISGGETNWHSVDVGDVESLNVDLKWNNANDSLRLVVYTPDGKILGPYDDASDGTVDGRINLNIANPSGVAPGEWYLKVTDTSPAGTDQYYVKTY